MNVDREPGLRDAFVGIEGHDGAVAAGDFSLGICRDRKRSDAFKPGILTQDSFVELCRTALRVCNAFHSVMARAAAWA